MPETTELSPQYSPTAIEAPLYQEWMARGLFKPETRRSDDPFVMVIPPPNVTAQLHMGHGLNDTVQDVIVRFERMRGRETLWVPGTDHAGIATQNVVERLIAKEGKNRRDIGREAFVERVKSFVAETGSTILEQLKAIGCSCDWSRTRYTFSPEMSRAVREVFVRLWDEGLIYRGHRVIHWCSHCLTSLSDEEAEHTEHDGHLYHIRYPLEDGSGHVTVATTRPETLLGDVAVAVNPEDEPKQKFVGKRVRLPFNGELIPIIADEAVELGFGSGFLKITPAHDPNDFEIGQRHKLPAPLILTPDAKLADLSLEGKAGGRVPAELFGMDRFEARRVMVEQLKHLKLLDKIEPHRNAVRHCYRCDTIVEPRLSDQWFVKIRPLAEPALAAYRNGEVKFIPERRGREYEQWLENIRDWNISRQLWWGHRIPIWYCDACKTTKAYREDPSSCEKCGGALRQDEDVLDTWFSSWLWPFSTLGWPDQTPDLERFYPTDVLVTAPEILFLWVARMIFSGLHFMKQLPFHTVYLHGTVRDTQHRKMSKSLGNGIDPLDVVQLYGADALRFTVINGLSVGTDIILDNTDLEATFASGRNFANKLWNVGRLVLSHAESLSADSGPRPAASWPLADGSKLALSDRWILSRLDRCVRETTDHLERFRLNDSTGTPYHFLWDDFADWYLEAIKPRLYGDEPGGDVARAVAVHCFDTVLRLLHPVMPFITETLFRKLPGNADATIVLAPWPAGDRNDTAAEEDFAFVQALVDAIRVIRADAGVKPGQTVAASVAGLTAKTRASIDAERVTIMRLGKLSSLDEAAASGPGGYGVLPAGASVFVALSGAIDIQKECARLGEECSRLEKQLSALEAKLANEKFLAKAPPDVIATEREKRASWAEKIGTLRAKVKALGC
ncbi:MAG TPA: valine--tRNA ligase [Gemmatimonadales bacterium]|jgi:valyl-tRNA synthetase